MRLVNYGPGEITDRLTILSLKVLIGTEGGKDVAHFERERAVLLTQISARTLNGVWFAQVLELAAVNAALWHAEDDLRGLRGGDLSSGTGIALRVCGLAFRIQALNDRRAVLIGEINARSGEASGEEKV